MKKIFFLTGEPSGDTRAADLIKALKSYGQEFEFTGICGDLMKEQGCRELFSIKQLGVTGFTEVVSKLPSLLKFRKKVKDAIIREKPDLVVAVDYPGFNISLMVWAKRHGFNTCYYVLPQVWAWKEKRKYKIIKNSDLMLSIIPFEPDYYGDKCIYIGNPVLKRVREYETSHPNLKKRYFGIFPGSRENEIRRNLPVMLQSTQGCNIRHPIITNVPEHLKDLAKSIIKKNGIRVEVHSDRYLEFLGQCKSALVSSGTATLEAALLGIPFALIYKVSPLTYAIAKTLAKIKYIGLPNILLNREAVPEFIQGNAKPDVIAEFICNSFSENARKESNNIAVELGEILKKSKYAGNAAHVIEDYFKEDGKDV